MKASLILLGFGLIFPLATLAEEKAPVFALALASDKPEPQYLAKSLPTRDQKSNETIYVDPTPLVTDADIEKATIGQDQDGEAAVYVTLTDKAAQRLLAFTTANLGRRLAVLMQENALIAPVIRGAFGKSFRVSGGQMSPKEAQEMADALNQAAKKAKTIQVP